MVTIAMISEKLTSCDVIYMPSELHHQFLSATMLFNANQHPCQPAGEDGEPQTLYVGAAEIALAFQSANPETWTLCIYGKDDVFEMPIPLYGKTIFCRTQDRPEDVFNSLHELFDRIGAWTTSMKMALLQGGDYQSLLDCDESVLENHVSISNSEFRLLAYTRGIETDDPLTQKAIQLGHHPAETVKLFKDHNTMRDWETQRHVEVHKSLFTLYPTANFVFRAHGNYALHVVMLCNNAEPTPGLLDTFQILIDHIGYCFKQRWNKELSATEEPSRFFSELITNRRLEDRKMASRLKDLEIQKVGSFRLYALLFSSNAQESQFMAYHLQHAKEAFPTWHIAVHGIYLLMLDQTGESYERAAERLTAFANAHPCVIGSSEQFGAIEDFYFAFREAKTAIEVVTNPSPSLAQQLGTSLRTPVHTLKDLFPLYVAEKAKTGSKLLERCVRNGTIQRIVEFDKARETNDTRILFTYLMNERNAKKTCDALFLHRSTLLYRISKMEERFDFNLDDPVTRQRLIIEYLLLPATVADPDAKTIHPQSSQRPIR